MVPEADLTSKWGRFLLGVYWWHQKQSSSVVRPCLMSSLFNVIVSKLKTYMALLIFKMTLCKRLCTFRQIMLLFNNHIITHAVNLDEKIPAKAKFWKLCKRFVILICYNISNDCCTIPNGQMLLSELGKRNC